MNHRAPVSPEATRIIDSEEGVAAPTSRKPRPRSRVVVVLAAVALAGAVAACGSNAAASGDGSVTLRLGYFPNLASSLKTGLNHAVAVELTKPVDLAGLYDLSYLNQVLTAQGRPEVPKP